MAEVVWRRENRTTFHPPIVRGRENRTLPHPQADQQQHFATLYRDFAPLRRVGETENAKRVCVACFPSRNEEILDFTP